MSSDQTFDPSNSAYGDDTLNHTYQYDSPDGVRDDLVDETAPTTEAGQQQNTSSSPNSILRDSTVNYAAHHPRAGGHQNPSGGGRRRKKHDDSVLSMFARGFAFFMNILAIFYALYAAVIFFFIILMWVFAVMVTIYVSMTSDQDTWARVFAVAFGFPLLGPVINVLDDSLIIILRTIRMGFDSRYRPFVYEQLFIPTTFPDEYFKESREVKMQAFPGVRELGVQWFLDLIARIPPKRIPNQVKVTFFLGVIDLVTLIVFVDQGVNDPLAYRTYVSLVAMLVCAATRFLRSAPPSLFAVVARLGTAKTVRWSRYTTMMLTFFILASCASSGFWADRSLVYVFSISAFFIYMGIYVCLMVMSIAVSFCCAHDGHMPLGERPPENSPTSSAGQDRRYRRFIAMFFSGSSFVVMFGFLTAMVFVRGSNVGHIDALSHKNRWWALIVWWLIVLASSIHSLSGSHKPALLTVDASQQTTSSPHEPTASVIIGDDTTNNNTMHHRRRNPPPAAVTSTLHRSIIAYNMEDVKPTDVDYEMQSCRSSHFDDPDEHIERRNISHNSNSNAPDHEDGDEEENTEEGNHYNNTSASLTEWNGQQISVVSSRVIIKAVICVFFLLIGLLTSFNGEPAVPNETRTVYRDPIDRPLSPYPSCTSRWGPAGRFNVTDMMILANAPYFNTVAHVDKGLKLWFDEPFTVTELSDVDRIGVRAYRVTFDPVTRIYAQGIGYGVTREPWMMTTTVDYPRVDIVLVRGSNNGIDWLQDAYIWSDSLFYSLLKFVVPFYIPDKLISLLVYWSKDLRYGVFGDLSYFTPLVKLTKSVIDDVGATSPDQVMVVGHSLGGGLAQLIGSALAIDSFAVSGVGVGYQSDISKFTTDEVRRHQTNIIPAGDPVPMIDTQIGTIININCDEKVSVWCHSPDASWREMARSCGDTRSIFNDQGKQGTPDGEIACQVIIWLVAVFVSCVGYNHGIVKTFQRVKRKITEVRS